MVHQETWVLWEAVTKREACVVHVCFEGFPQRAAFVLGFHNG